MNPQGKTEENSSAESDQKSLQKIAGPETDMYNNVDILEINNRGSNRIEISMYGPKQGRRNVIIQGNLTPAEEPQLDDEFKYAYMSDESIVWKYVSQKVKELWNH